MNVALDIVSDDGAVVVLRSREALEADGRSGQRALRYRTRTGALLRVDGIVRGAFDREHETIVVPAGACGDVTLEVERRALPTTGLPAGDGWRWTWLVANSTQEPARTLHVTPARDEAATRASNGATADVAPLALTGHSHLDIAWLWTYEETHRKAQRTFATAVRQLEAHPRFVFAQSQPQLFAWLEERDPAFFARVCALARAGRIDTSGAALWVEADCNLTSGESLLRQLAHGMRYVERNFGTFPTVAWLPDSFGFPNTLPALLVHADIGFFGTTKLGWNDTTTFPHARFVWEAPGGCRVVAAQIASIAGGVEAARVRRARVRGDLLLIGHGDGGGGASDAALEAAPRVGIWTTLGAWFARIAEDASALPVVRGELYLQEHRGTATTHHDIKARNAACERALGAAELALAWARALHATPFFLDEARAQLAYAWELVLRGQFHDVLPGSAIAAVARDAQADYDEADALIAHVTASARAVLPQNSRPLAPTRPVAPREDAGGFIFANDRVVARFAHAGELVDLRVPGGPPLVRRALQLAAYVDRPRRWDAWNVDRRYRDRPVRVRVTGCAIAGEALEIRYAVGSSLALASVSLDANEPFLRVELAVDWRERHTLLRFENELAFGGTRARFGTPHGAVDRAAAPQTRTERAKFEAPGQRYARIDGAAGTLALFSLDTYGWSVVRRRGVTRLGHSLLRGPTWPDPGADLGRHGFALALVPAVEMSMEGLETMWERFAGRTEVPMFTCPDGAVFVVATKLADDGAGIVVRARECDGIARDVVLRCGARAHAVASVDGLERRLERPARLEDGAVRARFEAFELRSFRVSIA